MAEQSGGSVPGRIEWWLLGIFASILIGWGVRVEKKFSDDDAIRMGGYQRLAAVEASIPTSDRRLGEIEAQLRELNRNVAQLAALAERRLR